jgi:glycosyltransferase involved in cell wall biosynthesis
MVGALQECGAKCHVLTSRSIADALEPFVHVVRPNTNLFWSKVRRRLDPEGWPQRAFCDALLDEIHDLKSNQGLDLVEMEESYGWPAMLRGRVPVPVFVRLHGPWFLNGIADGVVKDESFGRRDRAEGAGLAWAHAVSAPSMDVLARTQQHFGIEFPVTTVIPNPAEVVPENERWRLDECDRNRIAFIGRFDRHKGGDVALDAFSQVLRQFPGACLDFVGPDRSLRDERGITWSFDKYLNEKLPAATREKVSYHGFLPAPQAAAVRKRAMVTIVPSRYETFSLTAAEAMMSGCPLVVAGAGALPELVQHERNGLVAKPGDADDLAKKVLLLLGDPLRAAQLGEQARKDALERYSPLVVAKQTLEFYRSVLAQVKTKG